jgi:hypothetical protein
VLWVQSSCGDLCGNDILSESISPDGSKRAVLFLRGCGASTDSNWQVSILDSKQTLPNEGGKTFSSLIAITESFSK